MEVKVRELKECGSAAAYRRHLRRGETCRSCLDAANVDAKARQMSQTGRLNDRARKKAMRLLAERYPDEMDELLEVGRGKTARAGDTTGQAYGRARSWALNEMRRRYPVDYSIFSVYARQQMEKK